MGCFIFRRFPKIKLTKSMTSSLWATKFGSRWDYEMGKVLYYYVVKVELWVLTKLKLDPVDLIGVFSQVCKVDEDGKYGLDMRDINQRDGTDNDPNNIHKGRGSRSAPVKQEAIVLEAVLNATCTRCGG